MDELDSIIEEYVEVGRQFTCYHDNDLQTVIIKTVTLSAVIHSWVWPAVGFILGIVIALLAYHEKIGQPAPHDEDDDIFDRETIVEDAVEEQKKGAFTNKVGAIDELEPENDQDGEISTRTKVTTIDTNANGDADANIVDDKAHLAPTDDELYSNA